MSNLFHKIINETLSNLQNIAKTNPDIITSCKGGDDFELVVYNAVALALKKEGIEPEKNIIYDYGSHRFPDIIIILKNEKYGIEVKSSNSKSKSRSWKINGNSILGSTKDKDVIETYIIFGKTAANNLAFKARKYEDCVENIVVTHSPRYAINMDLPEGKNFFCESGISYDELSTSDNPIQLVTAYFKSKGEKAWWLAESTPASFSYFNALNKNKQNWLRAYAFAHFPEVLGDQQTKFKNFAVWMVTEQSIICTSLRDVFTGGGRRNVVCESGIYSNVPHVLGTLRECRELVIKELELSEPQKLADDWDTVRPIEDTLLSKLNTWILISSVYVKQTLSKSGISVNPIQFLCNVFNIPYKK